MFPLEFKKLSTGGGKIGNLILNEPAPHFIININNSRHIPAAEFWDTSLAGTKASPALDFGRSTAIGSPVMRSPDRSKRC
jgi:hypothetical protein